MADHYGNHRCIAEKNVPIAFILPSRWQDGAESLGIETTSCLCKSITMYSRWQFLPESLGMRQQAVYDVLTQWHQPNHERDVIRM